MSSSSPAMCAAVACNDNLSGLVIAATIAASFPDPTSIYLPLSLAPATIGSITWLERNQDQVDRIAHGLVLTLLGDRGPLTYKRSRRGNAAIDAIATHVVGTHAGNNRVVNFTP